MASSKTCGEVGTSTAATCLLGPVLRRFGVAPVVGGHLAGVSADVEGVLVVILEGASRSWKRPFDDTGGGRGRENSK